MRESSCSEHCLLRETVKLDTALQAVARVNDDVRVTWAEVCQAGGQQLVLALQDKRTGCYLV